MISLKLVLPLGCLVAISFALPWNEHGEHPQYPNSQSSNGDYMTSCDSLGGEARHSRPDYFSSCVCRTAHERGLEYAYNRYKGNSGFSRDDLAATLDRCPQRSYPSPAFDVLPAFRETETSLPNVVGENNSDVENRRQPTAMSGFSEDGVRNYDGYGGYNYLGSVYPGTVYDGGLPSHLKDTLEYYSSPTSGVGGLRGSAAGHSEDSGPKGDSDSRDSMATGEPIGQSTEVASGNDSDDTNRGILTVLRPNPISTENRDTPSDISVEDTLQPSGGSKEEGPKSSAGKPTEDEESVRSARDTPATTSIHVAHQDGGACSCPSSVVTRDAVGGNDTAVPATPPPVPHTIPPGHTHHVGKSDDDEGEE